MSGPSHSDDLPTQDPLALDRYAAGESDPAERALVERWLAVDPSRTELVAALQRARDAVEVAREARTPAERWERLAHAMAAGPGMRPSSRVIKLLGSAQDRAAPGNLQHPWPRGVGGNSRSRAHRIVALAGSLAVGTLVATLLGTHRLWDTFRPRRSNSSTARTYVTRPGERETVTLADGTHFTLAPASRLLVPLDYGISMRRVALEGEAVFAVVHDARKPFTVRAGNAVATDVGTRFDVRAYPGDPHVRVVVTDGIVALSAASHRGLSGANTDTVARVAAGELAEVDVTGAVRRVAGMSADRYLSWTDGQVEFGDTTLGAILPDLARWLDVDVHVADSALLGRRLKAGFRAGSTDEVLHAVGLAVDARVDHRGHTVTFAAVDKQ